MSQEFSLSQADVAKLLRDPSGNTRAETARKVAVTFDNGSMSASERAVAVDIFRAMLHDAEVRVRQALSESLKESDILPHDVAFGLAQDVSEVAAPILEFSEVLTDEDLINIVGSQTEEHQVAVARRQHVSSVVADSLADTHSESVVATLMSNDGAEITEKTFQKVLDEFGDSVRVNTPMVKRKALPVAVSERLVSLVSDNLRQHLVTHHELPPTVAADLVMESREKATVGLLSGLSDRVDVERLVEQLHVNGRLTPSLVLRSLCTGDIDFFEVALARLGHIPVANAHILIHDEGRMGLSSLYQKCGLPGEMYPIVRAAIDVARETDMDGGPNDQERYREKMIERVVTQFEEGFDGENLEYLLAKLGIKAAMAA